MAEFLTTSSSLTCPHGGVVTASTGNVRVQAAAAYVLRSSDTFSIAGCAFATAAGPSPCSQVVWITQSMKNRVGDHALTQDSEGTCIGPSGIQGTVLIQATQTEGAGD
jgi:hypothetical protein